MKEKTHTKNVGTKRLWGFVFNATYPEQYTVHIRHSGDKPEESAIIEAKRREHFKKDWLKLCNGHEENLSIKFKQQKGCTGMF